jgi:hypothetical protein
MLAACLYGARAITSRSLASATSRSAGRKRLSIPAPDCGG